MNIFLLFLFVKYAISQLRGKPLTPFTRMLAVVPLIQLLPSFILVVQYTLLETPYSFLSSPLFLLSFALAAIGLVIALRYGKPDGEESLAEAHMSEAPLGIRFIHQILDRSILILFAFLTLFGFITFSLFSGRYPSDLEAADVELIGDIMLLGISVLVILSIGLLEGVSHWSPAKLLTGYQVRTKDQKPIHFGHAALRSLCRLIPFDTWSFLFRANWHDRFSGTTLQYNSTVSWQLKQMTWMRKVALWVMLSTLLGFVCILLDLCQEERMFSLSGSFNDDDFFNFYWQLSLLVLGLFIPLQAGFSAAMMYHADCIWDKEADDKGSYLFISLLSWVPLLGWFVCSRSTLDVGYAYEKTHAEHPRFNAFWRSGRATRIAMHFYHILFSLMLLSILTEGWSKLMLFSLAFVLLFSMFFFSMAWLSYIKNLTVLETSTVSAEEQG